MLPGYFPTTYFANDYWADDYWPDYGTAGVPISAPLLNPGYWQTTYFMRGYWEPDYWPAYGTETTNNGGWIRSEYQIAYERLQARKKSDRIHRDDDEIMELLAMFTGYYDC